MSHSWGIKLERSVMFGGSGRASVFILLFVRLSVTVECSKCLCPQFVSLFRELGGKKTTVLIHGALRCICFHRAAGLYFVALPKTACCQSEAAATGENNLALSRATATNRKADVDEPGALTVPGAEGIHVFLSVLARLWYCVSVWACVCAFPLGAGNWGRMEVLLIISPRPATWDGISAYGN